MDTLLEMISRGSLDDIDKIKSISREISPEDKNDWDDQMEELIDNFVSKDTNPEIILATILPMEKNYDINVILIIFVRDFIVDFEKMYFMFKKLSQFYNIIELMKTAIEYSKIDSFSVLGSLILSYSDTKLSVIQIDNLISYAKNYSYRTKNDVTEVVNFFSNMKGKIIFAPVPEWVSLKEGENLSLLDSVSPGLTVEENLVETENLKKIANAIFYQVKDNDLKEEKTPMDFNDALQTFLSTVSAQETAEESSAFRLFGPINRFQDRDCVSNRTSKGPCRMLECLCREFDSDLELNPEDLDDWFKKKCTVCSRGISDRSHAVRIPIKDGGWKGCYCSLDCMRNDIFYTDDETNYRIELMYTNLTQYGIMNRVMT